MAVSQELARYVQGLPAKSDQQRLQEIYAKDLIFFRPGQTMKTRTSLFAPNSDKSENWQTHAFPSNSLNDSYVIQAFRLTHNLQFKVPALVKTNNDALPDNSSDTAVITVETATTNPAGLNKSLEYQMQKLFEESAKVRVTIEDTVICDIPYTVAGTNYLAPSGNRVAPVGSIRAGYYELEFPIAIPKGGKIGLELIVPEGFLVADLNKTTPYYPGLWESSANAMSADPNIDRGYSFHCELVCINVKELHNIVAANLSKV